MQHFSREGKLFHAMKLNYVAEKEKVNTIMLALLQRVKSAQVTVAGEIVGQIQNGLLVFLGVAKEDTTKNAARLVERVAGYRIFPDENDLMNMSVVDKKGEILVVSQFTLAADTKKGMRPSFTPAALPEEAETLFHYFVNTLKNTGLKVEQGRFGAKMEVSLINDGPVTFLLTA